MKNRIDAPSPTTAPSAQWNDSADDMLPQWIEAAKSPALASEAPLQCVSGMGQGLPINSN
jgi:hypothetical protein